MKILAVIPARYESTRFPGKVLANDTGKFLIQHTWERANQAKTIDSVLIAADDDKVVQAAKSFSADCVLTSKSHQSGTDRIAEAVKDIDVDIVVNLQADEPEIDPANIDLLVNVLKNAQDCEMGTLVAGFENQDQIFDSNIVKVVTDKNARAIYFSRSPIPYDRDNGCVGPVENYLRHLGIYAYTKDFLLKFTALQQSRLEKIEKLEQLRAIENGYPIITAKVKNTCDGIDTPQQYEAFVKRVKDRK